LWTDEQLCCAGKKERGRAGGGEKKGNYQVKIRSEPSASVEEDVRHITKTKEPKPSIFGLRRKKRKARLRS